MNRFFSSMWEKPRYSDLQSNAPSNDNVTKENTTQEEAPSSQENKSSINKVLNKYNLLNFKK